MSDPYPPQSQAAALEASVELENQRALDRVLGWVGLYVPTWGTSLTLHVAVILLAAFILDRSPEPEWSYEYTARPVLPPRINVEKRPVEDKKQSDGRGKLKPGPSSIMPRLTDLPLPPDVADNRLNRLEILGPDRGGHHISGGGLGLEGGLFTPTRGGDRDEDPRKTVYVVDRSGSMTDSIDYVKWELKRSLGELREEQEFHVIFYSSGPPVEMATRRLVNATERNRQLAYEFIDAVIAQGETDPSKALERAFAVKPDLIYLLTDGEFDESVVGQVKRLNVGGRVRVYTIAFLYRNGEKVLRQIADQNGGEYKFVAREDLAALAGG
jgi:hypothetical protein